MVNCRYSTECRSKIFQILDDETDLTVRFVSQNLFTQTNLSDSEIVGFFTIFWTTVSGEPQKRYFRENLKSWEII